MLIFPRYITTVRIKKTDIVYFTCHIQGQNNEKMSFWPPINTIIEILIMVTYYIVGSAKCSTKPLSMLMTFIISEVKKRAPEFRETSHSRGGVYQMWILKNSNFL